MHAYTHMYACTEHQYRKNKISHVQRRWYISRFMNAFFAFVFLITGQMQDKYILLTHTCRRTHARTTLFENYAQGKHWKLCELYPNIFFRHARHVIQTLFVWFGYHDDQHGATCFRYIHYPLILVHTPPINPCSVSFWTFSAKYTGIRVFLYEYTSIIYTSIRVFFNTGIRVCFIRVYEYYYIRVYEYYYIRVYEYF